MNAQTRNGTRRLLQIVAGVACALSISGSAQATLIGDMVDIVFSGNFNVSEQVLVTEGVPEVSCDDPTSPICQTVLFPGESIDIEAMSIMLTFTSSFPGPQLLTFEDLNWVNAPGMITGLSLVTDIPWLAFSDLSFTEDSVTIDLEDGDVAIGGTATITLETTHVPEPATWTLVLACLAFGTLRRGRR